MSDLSGASMIKKKAVFNNQSFQHGSLENFATGTSIRGSVSLVMRGININRSDAVVKNKPKYTKSYTR